MNISNTPSVQSAVSATNTASASEQGDASVQIQVLKKALNAQEQNAAALLQSVPQPALATQGNLGRNVNALA